MSREWRGGRTARSVRGEFSRRLSRIATSASVDRLPSSEGCRDETSPVLPSAASEAGVVRWQPVPARRDPVGGALVSGRFGLSYRDLEELLAERGIEVDHFSLYRWVQHFTQLVVDAARACRHAAGGRWFVDETDVKVGGVFRYVYPAVDQFGEVIAVCVSARREIAAAHRFVGAALAACGVPEEVVTDLARARKHVIENRVGCQKSVMVIDQGVRGGVACFRARSLLAVSVASGWPGRSTT